MDAWSFEGSLVLKDQATYHPTCQAYALKDGPGARAQNAAAQPPSEGLTSTARPHHTHCRVSQMHAPALPPCVCVCCKPARAGGTIPAANPTGQPRCCCPVLFCASQYILLCLSVVGNQPSERGPLHQQHMLQPIKKERKKGLDEEKSEGQEWGTVQTLVCA